MKFSYDIDFDTLGTFGGLFIKNGLVYIGRNFNNFANTQYQFIPESIYLSEDGPVYDKLIEIVRLEDGQYLGSFAIRADLEDSLYELEEIVVRGNKLYLFSNQEGQYENINVVDLSEYNLTRIKIKNGNLVAGEGQVKVKVTNTDTKKYKEYTTTKSGYINMRNLDVGTYKMTVTKASGDFKDYKGKVYNFKITEELIKQYDVLKNSTEKINLTQYTT